VSWIDDRIADQKLLDEHQCQVVERKRIIAEQAETTYGDLWTEIKDVLKEMENKGLASFTNGSPLQRVVRRTGKIKAGWQRILVTKFRCASPETVSQSQLREISNFTCNLIYAKMMSFV
jgi:hypothetical protein